MPLFAAYGRSRLARSRRWLEMAARACPGVAEYSTGAARACPGAAECSTGASRASPEPQNARRVPLEPALEPQNARRGPLEPALEPQHARKVPLEPTAVRCVRFLRSKWPLEKCCPLFVFYRHHLLLGSTLLRACYARVHTSIYINGQAARGTFWGPGLPMGGLASFPGPGAAFFCFLFAACFYSDFKCPKMGVGSTKASRNVPFW